MIYVMIASEADIRDLKEHFVFWLKIFCLLVFSHLRPSPNISRPKPNISIYYIYINKYIFSSFVETNYIYNVVAYSVC